MGTLAKTDAIDAKGLAAFGLERQQTLELWVIPSQTQADLSELVQRRLDLVKIRTAEKNRAQAPGVRRAATSIRQHLRFLEKQIARIEQDIEELFKNDETLNDMRAIACQFKGIGKGPISTPLCSII